MVRDFKYIFKRVIIGVLIALILSFISGIAKADTYSNYEIGNAVSITLNNNNNGTATGSKTFSNQPFHNLGSGEVNFTFIVRANNPIFNGTKSVYSATIVTFGDYEHYVCKIGTNNTYYDNSVQQPVYTASCPITFNNRGIYAIDFKAVNTNEQQVNITLSDFMSFHGSSNQDLSNGINNVNNSVNNVNNSINNDSVDTNNANDTFNNLNNNMPTNSVISDLLLMPINFINKVLDGANNSCTTYHVGELWGDSFDLPCINGADYVGSTLWNVIDCIGAGMLAFMIGKRMVRIFNDLTNLKDGGLDSAYD